MSLLLGEIRARRKGLFLEGFGAGRRLGANLLIVLRQDFRAFDEELGFEIPPFLRVDFGELNERFGVERIILGGFL